MHNMQDPLYNTERFGINSRIKTGLIDTKSFKMPADQLHSALCSLRTKQVITSVPGTPSTPPSSPPDRAFLSSSCEEVVDLSASAQNRRCRLSHDIGPQPVEISLASALTLGPSCFTNRDGSQWSASEYSDRSLDSSRRLSSASSACRIGVPHLPRTQCAVCKDPNMILFNGSELVCGHFVHRVCLKLAKEKLDGASPACVICERDCHMNNDKSAIPHDYGSHQESNDPIAAIGVSRQQLELLGENLIEREDGICGPETAPLELKICVNAQSPSVHEVLVRVSTRASAFKPWRYQPTTEDIDAARRLTSIALGITTMNGSRIKKEAAGCLRLVSLLKDPRAKTKVVAYLFEHAVVLTQTTKDGFEELIRSIDLTCSNVNVQGTATTLEFTIEATVLVYEASPATIAQWVAASQNPRLNFPIAQPDAFRGPCCVKKSLLRLVICLPFEYLSEVPSALTEMGPLDELGLVIATPGGLCAWIAPQKRTWHGWEVISREQYRSFDLFSPATNSVLETANRLLGTDSERVQKSIVLVAGCPLATTAVGREIHVVGIGDYDLDLLSSTAIRSGGQFYHAKSTNDLRALLGGIVAVEHTYTHHDVHLSLATSPGIQISGVVGLDPRAVRSANGSLEVSLGSLLAGQSRTVLVELIGEPADTHQLLLSDCQVRARSAITNSTQWETKIVVYERSTELQVFYERMMRMAAAIVREGVDLVNQGQTEELTSMLSRAIAAIRRAVTGLRMNHEVHAPELIELSDPSLAGALAAAQAEILARGLEELQLTHSNSSALEARAVLLQANLVLQNQRAVTRRTLLEQVFQEQLETNRI